MSLKNIISKSNETEEKALESKHVLLWGLNKVSSKLMKKAESEFKPTKRAYTKKEGVVEKVKVNQYDPDYEDYDERDLDFLNKEYKRISDLPYTDENIDLQDKLYDVIEQIESIAEYKKKIGGKGIEKSTGWIDKGSKPINIYGGSVKVKHVKRFIESSYSDKPENNIDQYIMDKDLSNEYAKTYNDPKTGHTVVVHRGTSGASDWGNNMAYTGGVYKMTDRYKNAKKLQDKANEKYGKENISTLGHSQGAILARELGKGGKEVISLNPAFMAESEGKNEHTIRSGSDVVSGMKGLKNMVFGNKNNNNTTIKSNNPFDVLGEHSSDILDRLDPEQIIGSGITKGSPEALARAEKMRLGKEAKRIAEGKPPPKGKYVKKEKILKPYYNIGEIPTGFREATEREAIENGKLSHWGKYQVNPEVMKEFKNVGFFFSKDLTEEQAKKLIGRMMTRMKGAIRDIPYVNNRLENIHNKGEKSKYYKKKAEIEEEGLQLKNRYKTASKMVDVLVKHIKTTNPKFTGVIKPKPEASKEEIREMNISDKTPDIEIPIERDIRKPMPKEPKITKTQLMDSFTHMTKEGKNVDIFTKVNIHKDKINPKIKSAMRESLLNEFDKEIIGHGIVKHDEMIKDRDIQSILFKRPEWTKAKAIKWLKEHDFEFDDIDTKPEHLRFRQKEPNNGYSYITKKLSNGIDLIIGYKIISTNNKYNEMNHHNLIKHHIDGLHLALHGAGFRGKGIADMFRDAGHAIQHSVIEPARHVAEHAEDETKHFGERTLPSYLIHTGIPAVSSALGGAGGEVLGGPLGGIIGATAGKEAGNALANYTGNKTGYGIKGYPKIDGKKAPWDGEWNRRDDEIPQRVGRGFKKGSPEMKAKMAKIRAMKK